MSGLCIAVLTITGCSRTPAAEVVVYTSHDQIYSEPVLTAFEKKTGIRVKAVYDVEATKTTGIVNRLIAEKDHPRCDVFWNNEHGRTIILKNKNILAPYVSPSAAGIPHRFKDSQGYWTGFGARARIIIYNTDLVKPGEAPTSIFDFTKDRWKGQVAMANPLFGTTATHTAALFAFHGEETARQLFYDLKLNNVIIVQGNSVVKDQVASGELKAGLTDTDDANMALLSGKPVGVVFPDQEGMGTLLIPNTAALIKNSPNPGNGRQFIDYLLSKDVESRLSFSPSAQIPVRHDVKKPAGIPDFNSIKSMNVTYDHIADMVEKTALFIQKDFLR